MSATNTLITVRLVGERTLVVRGEVDARTAPVLALGIEHLRAFTPAPMLPEVDLRGVTFLDAAGVSVIARELNSDEDGFTPPLMLRTSRNVRRVLDLCGVRAPERFAPDTTCARAPFRTTPRRRHTR